MPTLIYHITHPDNLTSILAIDGLLANTSLQQQNMTYIDLAYPAIRERRARKVVPCGAGGTLTDYVPFYFAPRSPMLYAIHQSNLPIHREGQVPVLPLVSTAENVQSARLSFIFTDGHSIMTFTEFFDDLAQLNQVDWQVMGLKYWFNTLEDGDRKRRRQAEFLVYQAFPWQLVTAIGVINSQVKNRLRRFCKPPLINPQS